jgi:hypothetical protein
MAAGTTQIADVVVPEIFGPYVQQMTAEKSLLIQSGALARDAWLDNFLAGGGLTINAPSFKDLDNDAENISSDDPTVSSVPNKIQTGNEIAARMSRNNSWSSMDLTAALAGVDPMEAIASRVSMYWTRRLQAMFVAAMNGVFADNAAAPSGTEHVQNDMTFDASGGSFVDGVTNFSAESFIDGTLTMGDSADRLGMIMVHSIVYGRMQKNNLIDFIPDSRGEVNIPTFLGRTVVVDDHMPNTGGVFQNWLFGAGAVRLGMGSPKVPVEVLRIPAAGNGGGQETLWNRMEWSIHPVGHKFAGSVAAGGPTNATSSNNLANAGSWQRVYPERKQIKIARLLTREF